MKIKKLKINGFGRLKDKEISFNNKLNIVKGNNESGKSTSLEFILSMLYGISKNKNGKEISNYEQYFPWTGDNYSGKIEYILDNGDNFEVYRDFKRKNLSIYNKQKEEISKKFPVDKNKEINFFLDQTGIDKDSFLNTILVEQGEVKLEKNSQNLLLQKMSNKISSGNENISYKKTLDLINKRQIEEVGSDRTIQKPINVVQNRVTGLEEKKKELEKYKDNWNNVFYELEEKKCEYSAEVKKKELLVELKNRLDNNRVKIAEINYSKNLEEKISKNIQNLKIALTDKKNNKKSKKVLLYVILLISIIIVFTALIFLGNNKKIYLLLIIPFSLILLKMILKIKNNKKTDINKLENEMEILENNLKSQQEESIERQKKLESENDISNKELVKKYIEDVDIKSLEKLIYENYDEIKKEIDINEKSSNALKVRINYLEKELLEINHYLDDLAKTEEELGNVLNAKEALEKLNNSYNIAKDCLEVAYNKFKQNISPKFMNNFSMVVSNILNENSNVVLTDESGLQIEGKDGKYIPVSRLSIGTIDEINLAFRISSIKEISNETMPIILDETFTYFDDERLSNILKYLNTYDNQIIIYTCSNREIDCLNRMNIEYNLINLEK